MRINAVEFGPDLVSIYEQKLQFSCTKCDLRSEKLKIFKGHLDLGTIIIVEIGLRFFFEKWL